MAVRHDTTRHDGQYSRDRHDDSGVGRTEITHDCKREYGSDHTQRPWFELGNVSMCRSRVDHAGVLRGSRIR
jgi:hypothetical protein